MTTLTTRTGQQYSSATPYKLKAFRYLMGYHAGVCELIMKKYSQPYIYIDLNCGAGDQPEYCEFGDEVLGSPIIALQELNKKGIHPICHFCDSNQEALDNLKVAIQSRSLRCEAHYWFGDNKNSLLSIAEGLCDSQFNGLIYSDPNGKQDFPLSEIKQVIHLPQMRKVDILMNAATTYEDGYKSGYAALQIIGQTDNYTIKSIVSLALNQANSVSSWDGGFNIIKNALSELRRANI